MENIRRSLYVGKTAHEQVPLLTDYETDSAYSLAYHSLYTNIRFNWDDKQAKQHAILLTIPTGYPGQSSVAANIAITAALNGTSTILIDADLRNPGLQERLGAGKGPGFGDWLAGQTSLDEEPAPLLNKTFLPNLRVLGAGTLPLTPQETSRLLTGRLPVLLTCLRQFLAETERKPALILFHSPPVLASIEAAQMGALVDQTYLVIATGRTTRTQARRAQEQLQRAHTHLIGAIMLDVSAR
jgi:Mrp family chromosome partitioning ATPase